MLSYIQNKESIKLELPKYYDAGELLHASPGVYRVYDPETNNVIHDHLRFVVIEDNAVLCFDDCLSAVQQFSPIAWDSEYFIHVDELMLVQFIKSK